MAMNLTTTSFLTMSALFMFSIINGAPVPTKIGSSPLEHRQQGHRQQEHPRNNNKNTFLSEVDDRSPSFDRREIPSYSQKSAEDDVKQTQDSVNRQQITEKGNFTGVDAIGNAIQNAVKEVREEKQFEMMKKEWKNDFMLSFQAQLREQLIAQGYGDMLA